MRHRLLLRYAGCGALVLACAERPRANDAASAEDSRGPRPASAASATLPAGTGAPPDTLSLEAKLERFRAAIPSRPTHLDGGATSPDALVRMFVDALAAADTARLLRMAVNRAEYAYLVYPELPLMRAPYRQEIDVAWTLNAAAHAKGITRLLQRLGGQPIDYLGYACQRAGTDGRLTSWSDCHVRFRIGADTLGGRMFSGIVGRDGRYNIMTYANDL